MSLSRAAVLFLGAAGTLMLSCGSGDLTEPSTLPPPSDVAAVELASGDLQVSWHDNSDQERSYELQRSSTGPSGDYDLLALVDANVTSYQDSDISGAGEFCYRVRAVGAGGTTPSSFSTAACRHSGPPAAPADLTASATFGQVDLSWSDNSENETGFEIWEAGGGAGATFTLRATVSAEVTAYSRTGLPGGAEYCYQVRALGTKGRTSGFTGSACATTPVPDIPPPVAPRDLTAAAMSSSAVALSWADRSSNEQGFELWRSVAGPDGAYAVLDTVGANSTGANDTGLAAAAEYCYRVRAIGGPEVPPSEFANTACATTEPPPPPVAPSGLAATPVSSSRIDLGWNDNASDEAGYQVWRSNTGASGSYSLLASLPAGSESYGDTALTPETEYCYEVRASGAGGAPDSPYAGPSCATTDPPLSVRVVTFGDSNTDTCVEIPGHLSSYVGPVPRVAPTAAHPACTVAGKIEAKWQALRVEPIRAVNHGIGGTTTGGGGFGGPERHTSGAPNSRTSVNGVTRYEAEVLGRGYPWSGGEPDNDDFPSPVMRVNAFTPGPNDFAYVSMGTNDAGNTRNMTPAETNTNLRWMVQQWIAAGRSTDHFMLTTLAPRANPSTPTAIPERNVLIRAIAAEYGVHLIDLAAYVSNNDGLTWKSAALHVGDGTHYTDVVRAWLADQVVSWISSSTPAN